MNNYIMNICCEVSTEDINFTSEAITEILYESGLVDRIVDIDYGTKDF